MIEDTVKKADLLIGAVLIRGARAPRLVSDAFFSFKKSMLENITCLL